MSFILVLLFLAFVLLTNTSLLSTLLLLEAFAIAALLPIQTGEAFLSILCLAVVKSAIFFGCLSSIV